ncbi:MAG TPA: M28 family peptidase, partial [bacterium]
MIKIKKLVIIASVTIVMALAAAQTDLVRIDMAHEDLTALVKQGLTVVRVLDHCALVLTSNDGLSKLSAYRVHVLDRDPAQHELYVVYDPVHMVDLTRYGDVLTTDGPAHVVRLFPGMLEDLTRQRVELAKMFLKPVATPKGYSLPSVCVDPIVQQIVADVSADTILSFVLRLQKFRTRYSTHDSCDAAANWVASKFTAYGCDTVYLEYHTGGHAPNVIGIKRGVIYPDSIYAVIDGHLDATSDQAPNIAPGADDNGSGTVAAIEAARVMKDYLFEYTAVYIAFTGEEFGLYGSEYYAGQADARNDVILGVLNGDMIAYSDYLPESLEVLHNSSNLSFANFFIACADTYTTLLTDRHQVSSVPSDIQPFYDHGYPGICTIEDYWPTNPHYHMTSDTIGAGYNNNAFCTEGTKAEIAALSILIKPYGSGTMPAIPTIIKPLDFARLPTVQPTLSFMSTDPNGDQIQYRVMWDTDPGFASPDSSTTATYPSGNTVDFVFPASLPDGSTYWWKVKCADPAGSGFWTNYTEARSLTIGTSLPESTCSWYQTTGAQFGFNAFNGTHVQGDSVLLLSVGYVLDTLLEQNFEASGSIPSGWT